MHINFRYQAKLADLYLIHLSISYNTNSNLPNEFMIKLILWIGIHRTSIRSDWLRWIPIFVRSRRNRHYTGEWCHASTVEWHSGFWLMHVIVHFWNIHVFRCKRPHHISVALKNKITIRCYYSNKVFGNSSKTQISDIKPTIGVFNPPCSLMYRSPGMMRYRPGSSDILQKSSSSSLKHGRLSASNIQHLIMIM